ncbi:hypothetical protein VTJ49DRAFT_2456 [Mycothermus thermophilus]|uniref:SCP domain-containing protein n=1 Tax=Humicola insolens TaxID=85995 RepID=A0ABR3V9Y7_HUMIN
MKTSAFLAACGAVLCAAGPIIQPRKVYTKTDVVIHWVTVTVTEGDIVTAFHRPNPHPKPATTTTEEEEVSTPTPDPSPEPASSSEEVVPPPPETSQEPEPTPEPQPQPQPQPDPQPQPQPDPQPQPQPDPQPQPQEPQPSPQPETPQQPTDYIGAALHHHNIHRSNHSAAGLSWSDDLANSAAVLAQRCVFAHDTSINGGGYGQNLAMWASSSQQQIQSFGATKSLAKATTNGWYNGELHLFASEFGKANPDKTRFREWGHFTQLVWKDTKQVGCATHLCPPGTITSGMSSWYTVCNYYPPGNVGGQFDKNVLPPQGQATVFAAE